MRPIRKIIIHCSDTETGNVESIRRYHTTHNGWSDIGYHYVILTNGDVEDGRPLSQVGAHCKGANSDSIGICLIGKKTFAESQFSSLRRLVAGLRVDCGNIPCLPHNSFPSAIVQGKTCPNFDVKEVLGE